MNILELPITRNGNTFIDTGPNVGLLNGLTYALKKNQS